ncbi:hypothetical protein [Paenibacillus beijingensis]|uniref:WYL domain-containing protein n=1 Tax=Paenibacillus beijingensis TaxID=1126833 RepID=A0A0D5NMH9_9BACL|nr:hypothetical protein [Paenibacillus beijingensis]AJY76486.1 hypothetical protein VN24_20330 [Paenibacillus beijingensis]
MIANVNKYIGRTIEIIYQDGRDQITQRRIHVYAANHRYVKAKCLTSCSPRLFLRTRILAIKPVKDYA